jgi:DNA end-binding protein Ku
MDALKNSLATESPTTKGKKPRKAAAGQKEMLLPIEGKDRSKKVAAKTDKPAARRKAG